MRIGLIDIDHHNFPNLVLMKLSAYHKAQGDTVQWYDMFSGHFDRVYIAKVFTFSEDYKYPIDADEVIRGGSGYNIRLINGRETWQQNDKYMQELPPEIEHAYPDYSLYNITDTAYGFLTRGCPRGCAFCHVASKEGRKSYKVADLSEFWNWQKNIVLCDPNILACKDWKPLLQQLIESRATIDFNQGLDIRMMTEEKTVRPLPGTKRPTVADLARVYDIANVKSIVVRVSGHLTCAIRGDIYDLWDCSAKPAYKFWIKKEEQL